MEKYVKKWLECGYISLEQSKIILDDIQDEKEKSAKLKMNIALYTIGAVLTGIGIICFIAANDWILRLFDSRFVKITAAFSVTFLCLYLGYFLSFVKKNFKRLADVLIFLSTLLIGGLWALIGQIYNFHTDYNFLIFTIWLISILPVAFFFKMKSVNILSLIIFTLAYFTIPEIYDIFDYFTFAVFGLMLYNFSNISYIKENFEEFQFSYKIVSIITLFFTILIIFAANAEFGLNFKGNLLILSLVLLFVLSIFNFFISKKKDDILKAETIVLCAISLFGILLNGISGNYDIVLTCRILGSNVILISIVYLLYKFGYRLQNTSLVSVSNFFVLVYVSVLYFKIGYPFLDKALFFILGGIILIAGGIYLEKQKRSLFEVRKVEKKDDK